MKPRVGDCSLQNKCTLVIYNCKNRIREENKEKKGGWKDKKKKYLSHSFLRDKNQDMRSKNEKE